MPIFSIIHSISKKLLLDILGNYLLLGPRGPLVPPVADPSVRPSARVQEKSGALTGCPKKRTFKTALLHRPPNPPASIHILRVNIQIHPAKI